MVEISLNLGKNRLGISTERIIEKIYLIDFPASKYFLKIIPSEKNDLANITMCNQFSDWNNNVGMRN